MQKTGAVRQSYTFENLLIRLGFTFLLVLSGFVSQCWGADPVPLPVAKVALEIEGKIAGFFDSVSGIGSENEVIEVKTVDPNTGVEVIQKVPGRLTYLDVVLSRSIIISMDLWAWRKQVEDGLIDDARVHCSIIAYDQSNAEVARWALENCWPSKIEQNFNLLDSGKAIEQIVIVHESIVRVM